jgi:excisionase family DNA binding protein
MTQWLTLKQAADMLGYCPETLQRLIRRGQIGAFKSNSPGMRGGRWRVSVDSLKSFIARRVSACREVV